MSDTKTATTDMGEAIQKIAEANNIMKENDATIKAQEEKKENLEKDIASLEQNKQQLTEENTKIYTENKKGEDRREEQKATAEKDIAEKMKALEDEQARIDGEKLELQKIRDQYEEDKGKMDRARAEMTEIEAQQKAHELEIKRMDEGRQHKIDLARKERAEVEQERAKLAVLKNAVEKERAENEAILARIEQARDDAAGFSEKANAEMRKAENDKRIAQEEQGAANYIKTEAYNLMIVFRQALNTFVQMNGTTIQISDITDEHRKFIIKDLYAQMTEKPTFTEIAGGKEEIDDEEVTKDPTDVKNYEKMAKPKLAEFAKKNYGVVIDESLTQKEMVQALVDHIKTVTSK